MVMAHESHRGQVSSPPLARTETKCTAQITQIRVTQTCPCCQVPTRDRPCRRGCWFGGAGLGMLVLGMLVLGMLPRMAGRGAGFGDAGFGNAAQHGRRGCCFGDAGLGVLLHMVVVPCPGTPAQGASRAARDARVGARGQQQGTAAVTGDSGSDRVTGRAHSTVLAGGLSPAGRRGAGQVR